jgi:hypothetical protein
VTKFEKEFVDVDDDDEDTPKSESKPNNDEKV